MSARAYAVTKEQIRRSHTRPQTKCKLRKQIDALLPGGKLLVPPLAAKRARSIIGNINFLSSKKYATRMLNWGLLVERTT